MKLKKKGFTLIELLGTIVIIALLSLIAIPVINGIINNNKNKLYDIQVKNIINAAKTWAGYNSTLLPYQDQATQLVSVLDLEDAGFLEENIKNPETNNPMGGCVIITFKASKNQHTYDYSSKCENLVVIKPIGGKVIEIELHEDWPDPGADVYDIDGYRLELDVIATGTINYAVEGVYTITYTIADESYNAIPAERKVYVGIKAPTGGGPTDPGGNPIPGSNIPVVKLNGAAEISIKRGTAYTDAGATVTSKIDGTKTIMATGGVVVTSVSGTYYLFYEYTDTQGNKSNTITRKVIVYEAAVVSPDGTESPVLSNGLIPVMRDEEDTAWIVADTGAEWYNYLEQKWANAVTIKESSRNRYIEGETYKTGQTVAENDILAYFVWIPRFSYTIKGTYGRTGSSTANQGAIDIKFITKNSYDGGSGTYSTSIGSSWLTHPAFTFGGTELSGFWIAKFRMSVSSGISQSKPYQLIDKKNPSCAFTAAQSFSIDGNAHGLNTEVDAHLTKNLEWGALAYLSQSDYGKWGNPDFAGEGRMVYSLGGSTYTGKSQGVPRVITNNNGWGYDNNTCMSTTGICTGTKSTTNQGSGASTTGNITGVYDVAAQKGELTAGVMWDYTNNIVYGYQTTAGCANLNTVADKYLDKYDYYVQATSVYRYASGDYCYWQAPAFGVTNYTTSKTGDGTLEVKEMVLGTLALPNYHTYSETQAIKCCGSPCTVNATFYRSHALRGGAYWINEAFTSHAPTETTPEIFSSGGQTYTETSAYRVTLLGK